MLLSPIELVFISDYYLSLYVIYFISTLPSYNSSAPSECYGNYSSIDFCEFYFISSSYFVSFYYSA